MRDCRDRGKRLAAEAERPDLFEVLCLLEERDNVKRGNIGHMGKRQTCEFENGRDVIRRLRKGYDIAPCRPKTRTPLDAPDGPEGLEHLAGHRLESP